MAAALPGVPSRFSLLKIEDSDDENRKQPKNKDNAVQKKKNRKKKQPQQTKQQNELRSLAFGAGRGTSAKKESSQKKSHTNNSTAGDEQWEAWKTHDEGVVEQLFEKQLMQALALSKVEQEQRATTVEKDESENVETKTQKEKRSRQKSAKKKAMSIAEFQNNPDGIPLEEEKPEEIHHSAALDKAGGDNFFDTIENDAAQILKRDKLQDEYKTQFKVKAVLQAKHDSLMANKDQEIAELKQKLSALEDELSNVKKRNKQLCFIIAQGEMNDKASIIQQVEALTQIKDELTAQLADTSSELEKERSKVHAVQIELTKCKNRK